MAALAGGRPSYGFVGSMKTLDNITQEEFDAMSHQERCDFIVASVSRRLNQAVRSVKETSPGDFEVELVGDINQVVIKGEVSV